MLATIAAAIVVGVRICAKAGADGNGDEGDEGSQF
jgi:hypothetical protein